MSAKVHRRHGGGPYRRRVALEWRSAVAIAAVAVAGATLGLLPVPAAEVWLLAGLGLVVLIGLGVAVLAWLRPVPLPPVMPKRFTERDATAAAGRVRRGEPVDPPELQAAAIDQARRGIRTSHLNMGLFPMLGASWALRIGESSFSTGFGYVGLAVMLLGISGLGWSGIVQARLNRLEDSSQDAPEDASTAYVD